MIMSPGLRKFALTAHVVFSVGWLGAVGAFLPLSIAGLVSQDTVLVRAVYLAMNLITWWLILPLCLMSLLSGVISSLGTRWGLFQYYWIVVKLIITVLATLVLLVHTQPISKMATVAFAEKANILSSEYQKTGLQLVIAAVAALVVLLTLTGMSVYKPRGKTPYGQRKERDLLMASATLPYQNKGYKSPESGK